MNWKTFLSIWLVVSIGLALVSQDLVRANPINVNILLDASGIVERKAPGWSQYYSVGVGDLLGGSDRLRVRGQNSYAVVWCCNYQEWRVGPGVVTISDRCPDIPIPEPYNDGIQPYNEKPDKNL